MPRKTFTFEGKRYSVTAKTETNLAVKVAMKKRDLEEGKKRITKHMLVRAWGEKYLKTYKRPSVGDSEYSALKGQMHNWICKDIGGFEIKDVKPLHCQQIMNGLRGKSASTVRKVHILLKGMFEAAFDNDLILENPARRLIPPKAEAGTHRALTDKERAALLEVCETHKYGLWALIMLYCGLRPGETARVIGKHIDAKERILYVDGTKTKAAKRYVPIPDILAEKLKKAMPGPFEHLFQNQYGRPIGKTSMRRMWSAIIKEMNIKMGCRLFRNAVIPPFAVAEDLTAYCLRHTYATDLQTAEVPLNVAKVLLGHSDISTTANIYTHESRESFEGARAKINTLKTKTCATPCASAPAKH
jgi:integrase